jgi:hypothetical protein
MKEVLDSIENDLQAAVAYSEDLHTMQLIQDAWEKIQLLRKELF